MSLNSLDHFLFQNIKREQQALQSQFSSLKFTKNKAQIMKKCREIPKFLSR